MKVKYKDGKLIIPSGFRRLRQNEILRIGDKYLGLYFGKTLRWRQKWETTRRLGHVAIGEFYIRRIKRKTK